MHSNDYVSDTGDFGDYHDDVHSDISADVQSLIAACDCTTPPTKNDVRALLRLISHAVEENKLLPPVVDSTNKMAMGDPALKPAMKACLESVKVGAGINWALLLSHAIQLLQLWLSQQTA